jgi:hypothetical protein
MVIALVPLPESAQGKIYMDCGESLGAEPLWVTTKIMYSNMPTATVALGCNGTSLQSCGG